MKNLGLVFKTMRKSRKLSLAEATGGLFSISMLSRFENGQAEMSAEKLRECLENIYLQMVEFEFMVSEFQPSEIEVDKISLPPSKASVRDATSRTETEIFN